jgi:hypothetical protein
VVLEWKGDKYTIPSNRVMGAIARVEQVITFYEMCRMTSTRGAPAMTRVAAAYASLLRYAGASADDEEIYQDLFTVVDEDRPQQNVFHAINTLMMLMVPPNQRMDLTQEGEKQLQAKPAAEVEELTEGEEPRRAEKKPAATNSSPKPTKRHSVGA